MKKRDPNGKGSLHPLVSALLAGGALIGGALAGSVATASPAAASNTYLSLNGPTGFLAAGAASKAIRTAQTYDAYYCYYYGYDCCDPATAEGREACCYYYGTYCNQSSGTGGAGKREDDYTAAGFAGAGVARPERDGLNPLL